MSFEPPKWRSFLLFFRQAKGTNSKKDTTRSPFWTVSKGNQPGGDGPSFLESQFCKRRRGPNSGSRKTYPVKLQALGKLIFYRHIAHVAQKVEKLCFLRGKKRITKKEAETAQPASQALPSLAESWAGKSPHSPPHRYSAR